MELPTALVDRDLCPCTAAGGDASEEALGAAGAAIAVAMAETAGCAVRLMLFISTGGSDGVCDPLCVWRVCEVRVVRVVRIYIQVHVYILVGGYR